MAHCAQVAIFLFLINYGAASIRRIEELKERVPIGAIFPPNSVAEVSFVSALARASMESEYFTFTPLVALAPHGDSYAAVKAACNLTSEGVIAIYGPGEANAAAAVSSRCRSSGIPHIQAVWRAPSPRGAQPQLPASLNLHPEAIALSRAVAHFIRDNDWTSYTLLYDEPDGLIRLQEILKRATPEHSWRMRRLLPAGDNRPLLKSLYETGETHVILDCPAERVTDYLRQANEVKFFADYMTYVLTSLDAHTLDLVELRYGLSNVTCLRVFDPDEPRVRSFFTDWNVYARPEVRLPNSPEVMPVEAALANDAARLITDAVEKARDHLKLTPQPITCDSEDKWEVGEEFAYHLLTNPIIGITDRVEVSNATGERVNFNLDIMELYNNGFINIAKWNATTGFTYTRSENQVSNVLAEKWQKMTFKVVSRIGAPYLVEKVPKEGQTLVGNDRYEGYSKDLIHEVLKEQLNLTYELEIVPDNKYGSYNKDTKKWDGLVKHLIDRKAHLALCDLTITYERRSAVDFTTPFLTLGISILYSKPAKPPPDLFSFLKPLSVDVWIFMGTAYLMVSLLLHVLARIAPNDWENPHPCDKQPEELENIWDIKNSLWLTMGSIMTQGSDLLPKGYSTRMVAGMWWFFALIMCSSYTANLAAFLTNAAMDDTIKSAEDLAGQTKIKYGAVLGGSTASFFKRSNFSTYQRMWTAMETTRPSVFCNSNDEGVERVLKGRRQFAYLMESTAIEYVLQRYCELTQIGGLLDSKGYGIAMPFESSYRTAIDNAVLKLAESGRLVELKNKWWAPPESEKPECQEDDSGADSGELGVDNVGGVFVVLGLGCAVSAAVGTLEFLWHVRDVAVEQKMSQSEALIAELKFALSFRKTEKPAQHSRPLSKASETSRSPSRRMPRVPRPLWWPILALLIYIRKHFQDESVMSQSEALIAELKFALSFWETEKPAQHSRPSSDASDASRSPSVASRASSALRGATDMFRLNVFGNK